MWKEQDRHRRNRHRVLDLGPSGLPDDGVMAEEERAAVVRALRGVTLQFPKGDFVAERFPSSQAGDFAVLEAGIVSEETYIEQGEYWEKSTRPGSSCRPGM